VGEAEDIWIVGVLGLVRSMRSYLLAWKAAAQSGRSGLWKPR
jgi:hypothetical protein